MGGGAQIIVTPVPGQGLPDMTGVLDCESGSFSVNGTAHGSCDKFAMLSGVFTSSPEWVGTFQFEFSGFCLDCGGEFQSVSGSNPNVVGVPLGEPATVLDVVPNPFARFTVLSFVVDREGPLSVDVVNVTGRTVRSLRSGWFVPGRHRIAWDRTDALGNRVGAGVYFLRVSSPAQMKTAKVVAID